MVELVLFRGSDLEMIFKGFVEVSELAVRTLSGANTGFQQVR